MSISEDSLRVLIAGTMLMAICAAMLGVLLGWHLARQALTEELRRLRMENRLLRRKVGEAEVVKALSEKSAVVLMGGLQVPHDLRHEFDELGEHCIHCHKHSSWIKGSIATAVCPARESPHGSITVRDSEKDKDLEDPEKCSICGHQAWRVMNCDHDDCEAQGHSYHWHCGDIHAGSDGGHDICTTVGCMPKRDEGLA